MTRDPLALPKLQLDLTQPDPVPAAGIERANQLMASGRLFRYGEAGSDELDVALLEQEFARSVGTEFCVAFNSCGAAMAIALKSAGVRAGDIVLMNAFTLAPVPGAVAHVGASPYFIGITPDLTIDLDDLTKAADRSGARFLLLSHMRGHITDMVALMHAAEELGLTVIEDCAHTMGAGWAGQPTGTFGAAGCFSTQTFKHVNSGEGGLLVTNDEDLAAQAILYSGSYMLYSQHGAAPSEVVLERHRMEIPNFSMRMSALAAAIARPQLDLLPDRRVIWNDRYERLAELLSAHPAIQLPERGLREDFVASSIQFSVHDLSPEQMETWIALADQHGVHIKWFGRDEPTGFTSRSDHWQYCPPRTLERTHAILEGLCDMRIPLALTGDDCDTAAAIITGAIEAVSPR